MAKLKSSLKNMVLSLFLISAVMSAALALVHQVTLEPIKLAESKKVNDAITKVVPAFDNDPGADMYFLPLEGENDSLMVYPATKDGKVVGTAISTYTNSGFSGNFKVMVGFLPDGTIYNSIVMIHKETPGLGTKMSDAKFHDQFNGKHPTEFNLKVKKDGGEVDAISAATITSRAYCDALSRAYSAYTKNSLDSQTGATQEKKQ
jgi:electron transport complex protein RnfG